MLGPRFGGINEARRDKYLMNEAVRKAGLAAVRQVKTGDWSEVRRFLSNLGNDSESSPPREKSPAHDAGTPCTMEHDPPKGEVLVGARLVALDGHTAPTCHHDHTLRGPETSWAKETVERDRHGYSADAGCLDSVTCVVKPARGCASGGVFLCRGEGEAEEAFKKVLGSPKYATPGAVNTEVSDGAHSAALCLYTYLNRCTYIALFFVSERFFLEGLAFDARQCFSSCPLLCRMLLCSTWLPLSCLLSDPGAVNDKGIIVGFGVLVCVLICGPVLSFLFFWCLNVPCSVYTASTLCFVVIFRPCL